MMATSLAFAVLLIILILGGALVEAAGRPLDSSTKSLSLKNLEDIDEESPETIPSTEDVADEDLRAIPATEDVDEEMATIPTLEDIMDEDIVTTPASEDGDLVTIPSLEGTTDDERVAIPEFLREYVSSLDPERIQQYEAALESNIALEDEGVAKDEVGKMFESLGDEGQSVTFNEKDIQKDQEIVFPQRPKESIYPSSLFLPHALAEKIPFSSERILELLDKLHISDKSKLATIMSQTLHRCELTKEKYSKETTLIKGKEKKKKKKGTKDVVKEKKKIVKETEFSDEFSGEFGKVFEEKEFEVKKGKSIEIKGKEVKKKETKWKEVEKKKGKSHEEKEDEVKKFLEKEKKKKLEKKKEVKENLEKKETKWKKDEKLKGEEFEFLKKEVEKKKRKERKKKLEKEKEIKKKGYKGKEKKFKEFKEKEFETFELEEKKERLSKENEMKKKIFDKEGKYKEEKKHKHKEFKGEELKKKGLKAKKDIKDKEFKAKKPKDKEFEVKKYKLKKEKVYEDKEINVEKKELSKETLKCVISLEDMTNFVKKKLPAAKYIKALETTSFTKHGDYKKIHWKVSEVKKHEKAVVCKKEFFPFAVFKCHIVDKSKGVRFYYIKLEGKDGVHRKEIIACEDEKKSLKSDLGKALKTKVFCRWITKSLIWVPDI